MMIGCTIHEAQQRVTLNEFRTWIKYREKFGPMNPIRRYDVGPATVAALISQAHGGKAKPIDFIHYGKEPEPDVIVDAAGFIAALGGRVKYGRKRG